MPAGLTAIKQPQGWARSYRLVELVSLDDIKADSDRLQHAGHYVYAPHVESGRMRYFSLEVDGRPTASVVTERDMSIWSMTVRCNGRVPTHVRAVIEDALRQMSGRDEDAPIYAPLGTSGPVRMGDDRWAAKAEARVDGSDAQ